MFTELQHTKCECVITIAVINVIIIFNIIITIIYIYPKIRTQKKSITRISTNTE